MTAATVQPDVPRAEEIIRGHLVNGDDVVRPGQLVAVRPDHIYVQDGNAPTVRRLYHEYGFISVFDPGRVSFVFDHSVLVADTAMADRMKEAERFAEALGIDVQVRGSGISHVIAAELGWFRPGNLVLGSDSHTCTGGAFGALGIGVGVSDIVAAMVTGKTWLRVPETIVVRLEGRPHRLTRSRDVLLTLLERTGLARFLYKSVEFRGGYVRELSEDASASLAGLGVELGAKCVFTDRGPAGWAIDRAAAEVVDVDVNGLEPVVSVPHLPSDIRPLSEVAGTRVDYVFLGSCTNSRLEDLEEAAGIIRGRTVARGTRFVVTPGSLRIYREALRLGVIDTLVEAGALVTPPGCGSCVGTQGPLPATGDVVLSTMNRNFRGRMGNAGADIYLASPPVATMTAILGAVPVLGDLE